MAGRSSKNKGANAERDAADDIGRWLAEVYVHCGQEPPKLKRNLEQVRIGGCDLIGIDWMAIEIKRHETLQVSTWWKQTVRQAMRGQVPVLMYRQNRSPWRFRIRVTCTHGQSYDVDMGLDEGRRWMQYEAWMRLSIKGVESNSPVVVSSVDVEPQEPQDVHVHDPAEHSQPAPVVPPRRVVDPDLGVVVTRWDS